MLVRTYKKEQAVHSRLVLAVLASGLVVFLAGEIHPLWSGIVVLETGWLSLSLGDVISGAVVVVGGVGIYVTVNRPRVVEFLVGVETELKKVDWPSRQELTGSTLVVILTMVMLALYLLVIDLGLGWVMKRVYF